MTSYAVKLTEVVKQLAAAANMAAVSKRMLCGGALPALVHHHLHGEDTPLQERQGDGGADGPEQAAGCLRYQ